MLVGELTVNLVGNAQQLDAEILKTQKRLKEIKYQIEGLEAGIKQFPGSTAAKEWEKSLAALQGEAKKLGGTLDREVVPKVNQMEAASRKAAESQKKLSDEAEKSISPMAPLAGKVRGVAAGFG